MKKKIIIDGQETNYSVTEDAHIYNDVTGKELKGTYATNEYHSVQLVINGKPKTFMFHRLVAEAFCENPNNYTIVDHIDRNKYNDHASNLRWTSARENSLNISSQKVRTISNKYYGPFDDNWTAIYGHETYLISKDGVVVNSKTNNIMVPQDRHGYKRVNVDGSLLSLHILVWESFNCQKVPEKMQVDHIDGNKSNNGLDNLRIVTSSENMKNAYANGHRSQIAIKQYSENGEYITTHPSFREAARSVNGNESAIRQAIKRHGTSSGYYWTYEDDSTNISDIIRSWIPEGYKLIKRFPTYCINKDGQVYNKRNKKHSPIKYKTDNTPFVIIQGQRIDISQLLQETFNNAL